MLSRHIHITGASGSGTTTLGRAVAQATGMPHHDTDDYFWLPTTPAYRDKRPMPDRLRLMQEMFLPGDGWVLSGSLDGWGDVLLPAFDLVVFLSVSTSVRLARLRVREANRYGAEAIGPGGMRHVATTDFLDWASHYDDPHFSGRSRARHDAWLARLVCPVLRLDGERPTAELADAVANWRPSN